MPIRRSAAAPPKEDATPANAPEGGTYCPLHGISVIENDRPQYTEPHKE